MNQIEDIIDYLTPSSDELQELIRNNGREDLPIIEFLIKYVRKLPDNLFNNQQQNIIFNDRKNQFLDIMDTRRQIIRNIERY
jgi:hypothetical protein